METFRQWCGRVTDQVRFWPDRKDIAKELTAHYEDHVRDLERLDYPLKLAEQRALDAMGDPEIIGKALDRVHRPWLGWLWVASRGVLLLTLVVALVLGEDIRDDLTLTLSNGTVLHNQSVGLSGRPSKMTSEWFSAYYTHNREPWFGHAGETHNVSSADLGGWYVMLKFSTREAAQAEWMDLSYPAGDWTMRLYWEGATS